MIWSMDEGLGNMIVSGAPYGGPIAVVRDRKQFVRIMTNSKPVITIYNCVGNTISKILVSKFCQIKLLYFSICITKIYNYKLYVHAIIILVE